MFGVSFTELTVVLIVTLVVVGPAKLPSMLRTLGRWIGSTRRFVTQVRAQTGIDQLLREEGLTGGVQELRTILRGDLNRVNLSGTAASGTNDPYLDSMQFDTTREYPVEGADALGALPDDLDLDSEAADDAPRREGAP